MKKNILVICALGYATSTMMKRNIEKELEKNNIKGWEVNAIGLKDSKNYIDTANIIVSSVGLDPTKYNVPVVDGIPLISGINKEVPLKKIVNEIELIDID